MKTYQAHDVKPGDRINGVDVFDTVRRGFDGYFIPLADGTRFAVKTLETRVSVS